MAITNDDYLVSKQSVQNRHLKVYLLDFSMKTVGEISGDMIAFSTNIDANSDIRRTCSASLVVRDSSYDIKAGSKIWLDRYIKPYVGTENIRTGEIIWKNQGVYLINAPSWSYSSESNTLSFDGVDLTAKLTGLRNGQLEGIPHVISAGSVVRDAIISTLGLAGFTKYSVSKCVNRDGTIQAVPYDIEISAGGTVWSILTALRDILPMYQMYFDTDGTFRYEQIPTGEYAPTIVDDSLWKHALLSENIDTSFESVKNYVEVYGATHDTENFASAVTISGGNLSLTIESMTAAPVTDDMIGFELSANVSANVTINVNSTGAHNLVDSNGTRINSLAKDTYYVAVYQSNNTWLFLGHLQAQAKWWDKNTESPFYTNGTTNIIRYVCSGGEYENIQSDELALERAKLEIYWRSRLNDTISLTSIPIPWLDVNSVISHAIKGVVEQKRYMIDSISADYSESGTMSIKAHTLYSYLPY